MSTGESSDQPIYLPSDLGHGYVLDPKTGLHWHLGEFTKPIVVEYLMTPEGLGGPLNPVESTAVREGYPLSIDLLAPVVEVDPVIQDQDPPKQI